MSTPTAIAIKRTKCMQRVINRYRRRDAQASIIAMVQLLKGALVDAAKRDADALIEEGKLDESHQFVESVITRTERFTAGAFSVRASCAAIPVAAPSQEYMELITALITAAVSASSCVPANTTPAEIEERIEQLVARVEAYIDSNDLEAMTSRTKWEKIVHDALFKTLFGVEPAAHLGELL